VLNEWIYDRVAVTVEVTWTIKAPGPKFFQICESNSCSDSGYYRRNRNLTMFMRTWEMACIKTTQNAATAENKKWLRIQVRFFTNFWLRFQFQFRKKNAESCRSRVWPGAYSQVGKGVIAPFNSERWTKLSRLIKLSICKPNKHFSANQRNWNLLLQLQSSLIKAVGGLPIVHDQSNVNANPGEFIPWSSFTWVLSSVWKLW